MEFNDDEVEKIDTTNLLFPKDTQKDKDKKIYIQAGWFIMEHLHQKTPRSAIKNVDLITFDPNDTTSTWPNDMSCKKHRTYLKNPRDTFRLTPIACYPGSGSKWVQAAVSKVI